MTAWLAALVVSFSAPVHTPPKNVECFKTCQVDQAGLELTRAFEGFSPIIYLDVAGKPTIGVGHLILKGEDFTRPLTPTEADDLLRKDMVQAVAGVNRRVAVTLQQNEFNALTDFTFNLGEGALKSSTLLKYVNAENIELIPGQFMRWVKAGGREVEGLKRRRKAEVEMYVG